MSMVTCVISHLLIATEALWWYFIQVTGVPLLAVCGCVRKSNLAVTVMCVRLVGATVKWKKQGGERLLSLNRKVRGKVADCFRNIVAKRKKSFFGVSQEEFLKTEVEEDEGLAAGEAFFLQEEME